LWNTPEPYTRILQITPDNGEVVVLSHNEFKKGPPPKGTYVLFEDKGETGNKVFQLYSN
jgi:hypothetical protein